MARNLNALGLPTHNSSLPLLSAVAAVATTGAQSHATTERGNPSLGVRLYGLLPPWDLIYFLVLSPPSALWLLVMRYISN